MDETHGELWSRAALCRCLQLSEGPGLDTLPLTSHWIQAALGSRVMVGKGLSTAKGSSQRRLSPCGLGPSSTAHSWGRSPACLKVVCHNGL